MALTFPTCLDHAHLAIDTLALDLDAASLVARALVIACVLLLLLLIISLTRMGRIRRVHVLVSLIARR